MNRKIFQTIIVTAIALATQANAGFVDITGGYNVLTFGDFTSYNDQTWGSLAASGNVKIENGYSIGTQWANTGNYPENVLVAGGNVNLTGEWGGSVWGGISAGGTVTKTKEYAVHGATNQSADINSIFDFENAKKQLEAISVQISKETAIAAEIVNNNSIVFKGIEGADINYFTVDAKDLQNNISEIKFENISNGSNTVITVTGKDVSFIPVWGGNFGIKGISDTTRILWNFVDAEKLTIGGSTGTILAVNASVELVRGEIWGDLISGSVTGVSQIHVKHYNGDFNPPTPPPSVPESSTTTMLVAGAIFLLLLSKKNALARK